MNKYSEASVIRSLNRKKASISINTNDKVIEVIKNTDEVGNGSWGKIDYLCKVHGYVYIFVKSFSKLSKKNTVTYMDDKEINTKIAKRERKLNMAKMVKTAMKANKR